MCLSLCNNGMGIIINAFYFVKWFLASNHFQLDKQVNVKHVKVSLNVGLH
jgi:hypothetical protein